MLKLFNDLDDVYAKSIEFNGTKFVCPVCGKTYARQKAAENHFERRECHKLSHLFQNTAAERDIYEVHRCIQLANGYGPMKLVNFRKSAHYTVIAKVMLFCWENNVFHRGAFILFVIQTRGDLDHMRALKYCMTETMLKRFRAWMRYNIKDEDSEKYYNSYQGFLWENTHNMLRAIERGDVGIKWLARNVDLAPFVARLEGFEVDKFEKLINGN